MPGVGDPKPGAERRERPWYQRDPLGIYGEKKLEDTDAGAAVGVAAVLDAGLLGMLLGVFSWVGAKIFRRRQPSGSSQHQPHEEPPPA